MAKIRVHELARELELPSKEMVSTLQDLGLDVKNHMSTMEESQASWVRKHLKEKDFSSTIHKGVPGEKEQKTARQGADTRQSQPDIKRDSAASPNIKNNVNAKNNSVKQDLNNTRQGSQTNRDQEKKKSMNNTNTQSSPASIRRDTKKDGQSRANDDNRNQGAKRTQGSTNSDSRTNYQARPSVKDKREKTQSDGVTKKENFTKRPATNTTPAANKPLVANKANDKAKDSQPTNSRPTNSRPTNSQPANSRPANSRPANKAKNQTNKGTQFKKDYSRPQRKGKHKKKKEEQVFQTPEMIAIGESIQVRDLAQELGKSSAEIVKKLMELGTMATINQEIDYDTVEIIASLYGVKVEHEVSEEEKILEEIIDSEESLKDRPPIVTVMGHVDHGKTSLLDRIRKADVVSGEAGGITQHIGAYQVKVNDNKITFIDTPGHEAFTAMRARGANLTDIVVLVVAADDGVMPQTIEAINHIKAANVPFIVAMNKIDKADIEPDRIKQQLTEYQIVPEEWGGETIFVPVSAKTGEGVETLLEMILLIAEMHELKSNPDRMAEGVVIEGRLDKGRGPVATVLVQKGTLKTGDCIISGVSWCKVRTMTDDKGRKVERAFSSMPVEITGWSDVPEAGDRAQVCDDKIAKQISTLRLNEKKLVEQKSSSKVSLDDFFKHMQDAEIKELNLIIRGDVQGSIEALSQSLLKLSTDEVKVNVIHGAVGAITETDVMLASASNAIIIGFNVRPDVKARKHAEEESIDVRLYRVIYEAIEDVKKAMVGLLEPEYKEKYMGRAEVRATFKVPNVGTIGGSYVIDGKIQRNANVRILREGVIIYEGKLSSLKRFKDDVKEVLENFECGIGIQDFNDIKESDVIEAYVMEEVPREL